MCGLALGTITVVGCVRRRGLLPKRNRIFWKSGDIYRRIIEITKNIEYSTAREDRAGALTFS